MAELKDLELRVYEARCEVDAACEVAVKELGAACALIARIRAAVHGGAGNLAFDVQTLDLEVSLVANRLHLARLAAEMWDGLRTRADAC
jgi:hypothetical protein